MTIFFSLLVWHLARMCFVQVGRLERCCCCLRGLHCNGSSMNGALWMCFILLIQDVLLAAASWLALDITFFQGCCRCICVINISPSEKIKKHKTKKTWHFDSRGTYLLPSPLALARLRPNLSSGLARVGVQIDSFWPAQPTGLVSAQTCQTHSQCTGWLAANVHISGVRASRWASLILFFLP